MRRLLALALLTGLLACERSSPPKETQAVVPARLPAADSSHATLDAVLVQLPDSGGFLLDGIALAQDSVPGHIAALFASRTDAQRVVLVVDNPARREDAQWISRAARMHGGAAFDAELSGVQPAGAP